MGTLVGVVVAVDVDVVAVVVVLVAANHICMCLRFLSVSEGCRIKCSKKRRVGKVARVYANMRVFVSVFVLC